MSKKKPRPRTVQRAHARQAAKLAGARRKLLALEPGGSLERPLEVESAALIEGRAQSVPCPDCDGALRVEEHGVVEQRGQLVRKVLLRCRLCGATVPLFFRVIIERPN